MMDTLRRMTGTEDGMLFLATKSLTTLEGRQNTAPGTMDHLIPMEPSLATEGMLWFDNLMIPDLILPFALSGISFAMFSYIRGLALVGCNPEGVRTAPSWNLSKRKYLLLAALVVGPATLMFPSAMLLYWISSSLAAVTLDEVRKRLPRIWIFRVTATPGKGKPPGEAKPMQQIYPAPTMKALRKQQRKK